LDKRKNRPSFCAYSLHGFLPLQRNQKMSGISKNDTKAGEMAYLLFYLAIIAIKYIIGALLLIWSPEIISKTQNSRLSLNKFNRLDTKNHNPVVSAYNIFYI